LWASWETLGCELFPSPGICWVVSACCVILCIILLSFPQLALSSDKIATLQMPLLNLHLDVKEDDKVKPYTVEMSKEELQSLISSLEAANKVCACLNSIHHTGAYCLSIRPPLCKEREFQLGFNVSHSLTLNIKHRKDLFGLSDLYFKGRVN
jgi:hypothetical protein